MRLDKRLVMQLTRARLERELEGLEKNCMKCMLCENACPVRRVEGLEDHGPIERVAAARCVAEERGVSKIDVDRLFSCLLCGSCALSCPYTVEIPLIIYLARSILAMGGKGPADLLRMAEAAARTGHSFGMTPKEYRNWLEKNKEVPVDKRGAEILYVPSPVETAFLRAHVSDTAVVLGRLGVDWTMSSRILDTGGNIGVDCSRPDVGLDMLLNLIGEAERLDVDRIAVGACGSDYKWIALAMDVYGELVPKSDVEFTSIYSVVAEALGEKRLPENTIIHDPCGMTRYVLAEKSYSRMVEGGGLRPRRRGPYTLCCGGGGGISLRRDPIARKVLLGVSRMRLGELTRLDGEAVITPCIKCYISFKYTVIRDGLNLPLRGFMSEIKNMLL